MRAINRYIVVSIVLILLLLLRVKKQKINERVQRRHYIDENVHVSAERRREGLACTTSTCIDFSRCVGDSLRVYVPETRSDASPLYARLLHVLRTSRWAGPASSACLSVCAFDTLDRDPLSPQFVKIPRDLPNNGLNTLVFNLFSGSWPLYDERDWSGFSASRAIVAKASSSVGAHRRGFDVSFPLFSQSHPARGATTINQVASSSRFRLVFKGKRYTYGIGSETRNALHHLHAPDAGVVIVTTCKHGKKWSNDERCERDNTSYDTYEYSALMSNASYCLVPRGRRLASFRFLEALSFGCVPVVLSNEWLLPFSDVIDWTRASVRADERALLQLPQLLDSITYQQWFSMRTHALKYYQQYFASVETIVDTTMQLLETRIFTEKSRTSFMATMDHAPSNFSVLIRGRASARVIRHVLKHPHVHRVHVEGHVPVSHARVTNSSELDAHALLLLDADSKITTEELTFGFSTWSHFPTRVVGFVTRGHALHDGAWRFTSQWTDAFSIVTLDAAFVHARLWREYRARASDPDSCTSVRFAFFVAHVTRDAPIKVGQRHSLSTRFHDEQECFARSVAEYEYMPLLHVQTRLDPVLFKDAVSIARKKFRKIESVT